MRQDDAYPEVVAAFNQLEANAAMLGGSVKASPLGQAYPDVDWTNLFRKVGDLTKRPFDWSADVAKLQARTLLSLPTLTTSGPNTWSSSGRRWEAASAMPGLMAHCGPQTSSQSCRTPLTTRSRRADAAGDRRALPGNRIEGSRSRRGPEFVGRPKQLAMAVGHAKAMENRRG